MNSTELFASQRAALKDRLAKIDALKQQRESIVKLKAGEEASIDEMTRTGSLDDEALFSRLGVAQLKVQLAPGKIAQFDSAIADEIRALGGEIMEARAALQQRARDLRAATKQRLEEFLAPLIQEPHRREPLIEEALSMVNAINDADSIASAFGPASFNLSSDRNSLPALAQRAIQALQSA